MDIFFCDIVGTFQGDKENRISEVKSFVQKVLTLVEIDQVDHIMFSFISTENMEVVKECIDEIKPHLNQHIKLGIQFSDRAMYFDGLVNQINTPGKLEQIIYATKELKEVQNVYFADDSEMTQMIVSNFFEHKNSQFNLVSFVPGSESTEFLYGNKQSGITGLNKIMDHYIQTKKPQTKPVVSQKIRRYS